VRVGLAVSGEKHVADGSTAWAGARVRFATLALKLLLEARA
jgi:hypothetical protein